MTYIYGLTDPSNDRIYYIGKSDDPERRLESHLRDQSGTPKVFWLRELETKGLLPGLRILSEADDSHWREEEENWILKGFQEGWPLTNSRFLGSSSWQEPFGGLRVFLSSSAWDSFCAFPRDIKSAILHATFGIVQFYFDGRWDEQQFAQAISDIRFFASSLTFLALKGTSRQFGEGLLLTHRSYSSSRSS